MPPALLAEADARAALVAVMRRMHLAGLNRGTAGNASIRVDGGMIVTPSGVAPDELAAASMVFVADDASVPPGQLIPSSEHLMHLHILRGRPDAGAVVHCHSRHATILACLNRPIEPIHYMVLVTGAPRVPVAPFAPFGTPELAAAVVATMGAGPGAGRACLMAHHGQVTIGATWQQALAIAEEVEEQAAVSYGAALLGGAAVLGEADLAATMRQFAGYGQARSH